MNVVLKLGHVQNLVVRNSTHALKVETDNVREGIAFLCNPSLNSNDENSWQVPTSRVAVPYDAMTNAHMSGTK